MGIDNECTVPYINIQPLAVLQPEIEMGLIGIACHQSRTQSLLENIPKQTRSSKTIKMSEKRINRGLVIKKNKHPRL